MSPPRPGRKDGAQTLHRATALLHALTAANGKGLTALELAHRCGLARSTVHRLLTAMKSDGLVAQPPSGRHYYLGPLIYKMGLVAAPELGIRELCSDVVSDLAARTATTCFLTLRNGMDGICVDRCTQGDYSTALDIDIGTRRPLGVGLGSIAILAALPAHECAAVIRSNGLRYGDWTSLGVSHIKSMVARTQRHGYAFTANDYINDIGGFALTIRDPQTRVPFAAISLASPVKHMPAARSVELLPLLKTAVANIESRLRNRHASHPQS